MKLSKSFGRVLLVATLALLVGTVSGSQQVSDFVVDGFEDGDYSSDPSYTELESSGAASLSVQSGSNFGTYYLDAQTDFNAERFVQEIGVDSNTASFQKGETYYYYMYTKNSPDAYTYWSDGGSQGNSNNILRAGLTGGGSFRVKEIGTSGSYNDNQWYNITIRQPSGTQDLEVNYKDLSGTVEHTISGNLGYDIGTINYAGFQYYNSRVYFDNIILGHNPNSPPNFDSVSTSPSSWTLGSDVDVSASVSNGDGTVSGVSADVWEDGTQIVSDASLTDSDGDGKWDIDNLFTVDESDVYYNLTLTAEDDDGATSTFEEDQFIQDKKPVFTIEKPDSEEFTYSPDYRIQTQNDGDDVKDETLDCSFSDNGTTSDTTLITEGDSFSSGIENSVGSYNFTVSCTEQDGDANTREKSTIYEIIDFKILSVSSQSQVFETEERSFSLSYRSGDMIQDQDAKLDLNYGTETTNKSFSLQPSQDSTTNIKRNISLVDQNQTVKNFNLSVSYSRNNPFDSGSTTETKTSNTKQQTVLQSYFIEGSSTPPRNGDYIETENLQHVLQVHTQTKKADLSGTTTYERNQETSQMQETTAAQDLNQFKAEIDTGLASNFNKSKFNVSSDIQVSFEGDTRTLQARDEIEVYRIQITDGSTNLNTEKALNFDIDSEETGNSVKANFQADFSVFKDRDQKIRRFNFQKPAKKEHDFFIYPSWAEYKLRTLNYPDQQKFDLIQFFNEDTNKVKRSYFFPQVQTINNDTTTVPLKTINRSETRLIDFEMSNSEGDPAENVYCRVDRKFAGGNFQTSFVFNTNSEGKAEAAAETTGTFYGLKCFKDGEIIETFSAQKLQDPVRLQFGAAAETTRLNFFEKFDSACTTGTTFVNCSYQSQSEKLEKAVLDVERQEIVQDVNVCTETGSTATGRLVCTGLNTSKDKYKFDVQAQYPDTTTQGTVGFTGTKQASIPFSGLFMTAIIFMLVTSASAYNITIGIGAGTLTMLLMSVIEFITLTPGQRATLIAVAIIAGVAIQR